MIRDIPRQVSAALVGLFGRESPEAYIHTQRQRIEKLQNQVHGKNKVLAIASGKGGLAKSTTAVHLTLALAELGLKVALVDMDLTAPAVRGYFAEYLRESKIPRSSMIELINGTATPEEVEIHPSYLDATGTPRELKNISLHNPQQGQEMRMRAHERLFSQGLQSIIQKTPLARDFTIIDLPAGIREDVVNTWRISDYGILIFEPCEVPLETDLYTLNHPDITSQDLFNEGFYTQLKDLSYGSVRELKERFYLDLKRMTEDKIGQYEFVTGRSFQQDVESAMVYPGKKVIPIVTRVKSTQEELRIARETFPRIRNQEAIDGVETQLIMLPNKTELVEDPQIILYSDEVIKSSKAGLPLIHPVSLREQKSWTEASRSYREIAWQIATMEYLGVTG